MSKRVITRAKNPQVIPQVAREFPFNEATVVAVSERLGEPGWMREKRLQAWGSYQAMPMPTLTDEPWRRTDIRALPSAETRLNPRMNGRVDGSMLQAFDGRPGASLLMRPGYPDEVEAPPALSDQGVIFSSWSNAVKQHADLLQATMGKIVRSEEGKFAALACSLAENGLLVYLPSGVVLEQPLHSLLWIPGGEAAFFSRILIVLEENSSLKLVHEIASPSESDSQAVHAGLVEVLVGEGAELGLVEIQNLGEHVWNFTHERAEARRQARLDWTYASIGSRLTKTFSEISLTGEGAHGRMSGFYLTNKRQHLDHDTQQSHHAPHTTSDLLFKGALTDQSRSVWQGMIYVAPGAQKTDGYQANRNLILSKRARADSIPGLEILADDVRCTHGATVGQLEEEPLFYLMSRGVPRAEAERVLIDGFFAPVFERTPLEAVRERFKEMIAGKLG